MVKKSSTILILVITFTCNYVNIKCCPNMINVLLLRTESKLPTPPEGRFSKNHLIKTWLSDLETKAKRWFYQQLVEGVPHLRWAEDQDGEAVPENPKNPNNHLRRETKCQQPPEEESPEQKNPIGKYWSRWNTQKIKLFCKF